MNAVDQAEVLSPSYKEIVFINGNVIPGTRTRKRIQFKPSI